MNSDLLNAAGDLLDRGLSLIPMRGKKPAVRWKRYQQQPATRRHLRRWFDDARDYTGMAVVFGHVSGCLAARDFDTADGYDRWQREQPRLAALLPTWATARGRQVCFRADPAELLDLRRRLGKPNNIGAIKLPGGELRADVGCYSVLPPSLHPTGFRYQWAIPLPAGDVGAVPCAPLSAFATTTINVSAECYTCNVSTALAAALAGGSDALGCDDFACSDAAASSIEAQIEQAIQATLPSGSGERNAQIFALARQLKAIPTLATANATALEPIVRRWFDQALPHIRTKSFDESRLDFIIAWGNVKRPSGGPTIGAAVRQAVADELPPAAMRYDDPRLRRLVAVCRELQRLAGPRPFFVSCAKAAELVGLPVTQAMTTWRWLKLLVADGVLARVTIGTTGRQGKASEYRYLAGDFSATRAG